MISWQRAVCEQTARELNAQVIREYVEYGGTGSIDKRPAVRFMLDELRARHDATYLIVARTDRLARQGDDWARISREIQAAGAELVTAATQADTGIIDLLSQ
ncbi:MAG: recombinase family protein [Pseudonocardiaceae bacterium]